jgi:hypothetical protein
VQTALFHVKRPAATRRPGGRPSAPADYCGAVAFMFDLELDVPPTDAGQAIEWAVADAGAWPVRFEPGREEQRWYGVKKAYPAVLEILTEDGQGHILSDPAEWDEDAWPLRPDAEPRLAETIRILGRHFPAGFVFRATWAGSPILRDEYLSADSLADLALTGRLNDHTRYRVTPSA